MPLPEPTDAELWAQAARRPEAFAELFSRHARAVHAYCARRSGSLDLADDLTSVVFMEAWRKRRSVVITGSSVRAWLLGVATNVQRNSGRSLRRQRALLERVATVTAGASPGPEEHTVDRLDAQTRLSAALESFAVLSEDERDIVALVAWSDLTYEEAAAALHVPVGTVRSRLARARQKLKADIPAPAVATSRSLHD